MMPLHPSAWLRRAVGVCASLAAIAGQTACDRTTPPELPASMLKVAGDGVAGVVGTALRDSVVVRVVDRHTQGMRGVQVRWSITAQSGSLSDSVVITDARGNAMVVWTLGTAPGPQTVSAQTGGLSAVTFTVTAVAAQPARLVAESGNNVTAEVDTEVLERPTVLALDRFDNPVPGVSVRFEASGYGQVEDGSQITDDHGRASPGRWVTGRIAGANMVVASAEGVSSIMFLAYGVAAAAVALEASLGNNQIARPGDQTALRPTVRAVDRFGNSVAGVDVGFNVLSGGGAVVGPTRTTDERGLAAAVQWTLGPTPGRNELLATSGDLIPATFVATATEPTGDFGIRVQAITELDQRTQHSFQSAVDRWERVVRADIPAVQVDLAAGRCFDGQPGVSELIDDLLILAAVEPIDGPGSILAQAGWCAIRSDTYLPLVALVRIDADDAGAMTDAILDAVILHEIGHALGIGTHWRLLELVSDTDPVDPVFTGPAARAAYGRVAGLPVATNVPVENTGPAGTVGVHWRKSALLSELMTGYISPDANPLSVVTIGSLRDLGYIVQDDAADPFTLATGLPGTVLDNMIELTEAPLNQPIAVIDRDGHIRYTIRPR